MKIFIEGKHAIDVSLE